MTKEDMLMLDLEMIDAQEYFSYKWMRGALLFDKASGNFLADEGKAIQLSKVRAKQWMKSIKSGEFANPQFLSLIEKAEIGHLYRELGSRL